MARATAWSGAVARRGSRKDASPVRHVGGAGFLAPDDVRHVVDRGAHQGVVARQGHVVAVTAARPYVVGVAVDLRPGGPGSVGISLEDEGRAAVHPPTARAR